jgi:carbamate kinase
VLVVAALGGNALLRRGEPLRPSLQAQNVAVAAAALAEIADGNALVVTHGNGPQVGLLALEDDAAEEHFPLDVLVAETQGMIGYLLEQELGNRLPGRAVITLLTRVIVSPEDPAFANPSKPIGPVYDAADAEHVGRIHGWTMARDGRSFRRVVPSPRPLDIVELGTVKRLLDAGAVAVCTGGGGIPVARHGSGLRGVEAVVDKDLAAALLAEKLEADLLLLLTDVSNVYANWGTESAAAVGASTPAALRALPFEAGSMGPKVDAVCTFVERTGRRAAIGALDDVAAIVAGRAGTQLATDSRRRRAASPPRSRALRGPARPRRESRRGS